MRLKTLLPAVVIVAAGCQSILDVKPINEVEEASAVTTPAKARAALAGMYDGLQSTGYYGGTFVFFGDLSADDVRHTGTFTTYHQADLNQLTSDNTTVEGLWDALYRVVGRANIIIERVPTVAALSPDERDHMLGEAHFARALTFHNAVKFWGEQSPAGVGVPLPLIPPPDIASTSNVTRATTGQVYTQILSDLAAAESLLTVSAIDEGTHRATVGAVRAIRARVFLYQQNWAGAEAEAESVAALGYALAPKYEDLFTQDGQDTPEDIFVLEFTPVDFQLLGYYYRAKGTAGGRREIGPTTAFIQQYAPGYSGTPASFVTTDKRGQHNISFQFSTVYGSKWPTGIGGEDFHVIRFAEVLLIKAEAEVQQGKLAEADSSLNAVRVRAGLAPLDLVTLGQPASIDAILHERLLELAFEGDRWPDLVRTGRAVATLGIAAFQQLYPIPLNELDVVPGLVQNPGY
jgi:starch-binding outer membrane protein, SusD/RagB family